MKKCSVVDCEQGAIAKGLCKFHWQRQSRGTALTKPKKGEPNRYEVRDTHAVIFVHAPDGTYKECLIDTEDLQRVLEFGAWYAELRVDHKEGNGLDNRKEKLRKTTRSGNATNQYTPQRNNTSGHTGVWFSKQSQKWIAEGMVRYKKYHLGSFSTKEKAAEVAKAFRFAHIASEEESVTKAEGV